MASFQPYADIPAIYDNDRHHWNITSQTDCIAFDNSWAIFDPTLHHIQNEYSYQSKQVVNYEHEPMTFPQPGSSDDQYQLFPTTDTSAPLLQQVSWNTSFDNSRASRYHSPNGPFGGTLSECSSDYTLSPQNRRSSISFQNTPMHQSFDFAPSPMESQLSQHSVWASDHTFVSPLSTNSPSLVECTNAIAPCEVEFQCFPDYHIEQALHEDDNTIKIQIQLPMQAEELELSDSVTSLTMSSRTNTFSSEEPESSEEEEINNEVDPDFSPHKLSKGWQQMGYTKSKSFKESRSPHRSAASQSRPVLDSSARIHKKIRPAKAQHGERSRQAPVLSPSVSKSSSANTVKPSRAFPCAFHAFGCHSTFGNKNEWKRHVSSQHLQLEFYRCDLGPCNPDSDMYSANTNGESRHKRKGSNIKSEDREVVTNDFNRKDLFTQHCRRMHGPERHVKDNTTLTNQRINERIRRATSIAGSKSKAIKQAVTKEDENAFETELEEIRQRCLHIRRKAPSRTSCGLCPKKFEVDSNMSNNDDGKAEERAWEKRMEHIGRHYERDGVNLAEEEDDEDLIDWGIAVGVLEIGNDKRAWLVGREKPKIGLKEEPTDIESSPRRAGLRTRNERHSSGRSAIIKREVTDDFPIYNE